MFAKNSMRYLLISFAFLFSFLKHTYAQAPDSILVFLDSALHVMQQHSMYSKNVDWKAVNDSAHRLAQQATTYAEAAPALKYAFNQLGDKHGWVVVNDTDYHNPAFALDTGRTTPVMKDTALHHGGKVFS